jgi:hypothetical protein
MFGCISVVEGVCFKDCKHFGLYKVGTVGLLVSDECVGGRWSGDMLEENGRGR